MLEGKNYELALKKFEQKKAKYGKIKKRVAKESARLRRQADITRYFKIRNFGTYNCDRFAGIPNAVRLSADFNFGDEAVDQENLTLFHINGERRGLITLTPKRLESFTFSPDEYNCIVAALPDNRFAVFTNADFQSINRKQIIETGSFSFTMKSTDTRIQSMDDLRLSLDFSFSRLKDRAAESNRRPDF